MIHKLLTRTQFNENTFKIDKYKCVFFSDTKIVAHHWAVEKTDISVEDVRKSCGITNIIIPKGFDPSKIYDKWGNIILPNGRRQPGLMFFEDGVQKILKDKLWLFNF